jgi:hypothetical protein
MRVGIEHANPVEHKLPGTIMDDEHEQGSQQSCTHTHTQVSIHQRRVDSREYALTPVNRRINAKMTGRSSGGAPSAHLNDSS